MGLTSSSMVWPRLAFTCDKHSNIDLLIFYYVNLIHEVQGKGSYVIVMGNG